MSIAKHEFSNIIINNILIMNLHKTMPDKKNK